MPRFAIVRKLDGVRRLLGLRDRQRRLVGGSRLPTTAIAFKTRTISATSIAGDAGLPKHRR